MFRLPKGWSRPTRLHDVVVAAGVKIHRSGVAATAPSGEEICGSAADRAGATHDRAWFELAERVCALEAIARPRETHSLLTEKGEDAGQIPGRTVFPQSRAPRRWVYSRSNGIALHVDWPQACRRAYWELAERDRVLRSWCGEVTPERLKIASPLATTRRYEWLAYSFPARPTSFSSGIAVVGVFGFPLVKRLPLAMGFAARPVLENALDAAALEAFQQLAFLWGEPAPVEVPTQEPSAGLHLDTYQIQRNHPRLRAWLDGGHRGYAQVEAVKARRASVRFVDLTAPWLNGKARVAKAICPDAVSLGFGEIPSMRHLPVELRIHPIA